jgi:hypothetical protein
MSEAALLLTVCIVTIHRVLVECQFEMRLARHVERMGLNEGLLIHFNEPPASIKDKEFRGMCTKRFLEKFDLI